MCSIVQCWMRCFQERFSPAAAADYTLPLLVRLNSMQVSITTFKE